MSMKGEGGQVDQDPGDFVPFWNESPSRQPVKLDHFTFGARSGLMSLPAVRDIAIPGRLSKTLTYTRLLTN